MTHHDKHDHHGEHDQDLHGDHGAHHDELDAQQGEGQGGVRPDEANPPYTTKGKVTAPKFGSAGSGGLEYEGPLPKD